MNHTYHTSDYRSFYKAKEIDVTFNSRQNESIHIYYTDGNSVFPVYIVEITGVIPNIAYKQGDKTDYIIKEIHPYGNTNEVELSGSTVALRPLFITKQEQNLGIDDVEPLLERNIYCSQLVDSITWDGERHDVDNSLDWIEYSLKAKKHVYETVAGGTSIKGVVRTSAFSPFVTVTRSTSNEETGYYIEDYYSTAIGGISNRTSLRDENGTMKGGGFEVLGTDYKIPIVHYKNPCTVKLLLTNILQSENPSPLQYKIGERNAVLGTEFTLQMPPNGTILDIKDVDGNIRGKIEFRQVTEPLLSPTLNIVTLNTDNTEVNFSTVINDLNAVYNTMNVAWQQG
ncbi:MAG: hypothetical protein LBG28_04370, partial [Tannerella sp.]|nr:hypothetical protein [Tannerella sp.]